MGETDRLSQLEALWSSIWDAAPDGVFIVDAQGRIESCNPAAQRMFGHGELDVAGRPVHELLPELAPLEGNGESTPLVALGHTAETGARREIIARRIDGSTFPAYVSAGEFSISGRSGFTAIVHDISALKQTEARLRQREEQLKLTIQHAPTGICTVDLSGRFLTVNGAFCSMVGYSEDELVQRPVDSITHPDDVELGKNRLRQLRSGEIDQYRVRRRYLRKNGGVVEAVITAAVVHDFDGMPLLYVAQVEDLTDRLRAEREASESRERLAHVTRVHMIGEMVAGIAHEINQPLTAIATYAQASGRMIRSGMLESGELLAALDKIGRQAERAGDVIRHLRRLVRGRSSTAELTDLNALIAEIVPLAEVDARMHDATINLNLADALRPVLVDPIQIQQVVLNLVRNAMEATQDSAADAKIVTIGSRVEGGGAVEIWVHDRGVGISSDAEQELFRTFFTTKASGMGIGLAVSRSIVNSHGGGLWFTRNPDRGVTFHVSLPVADGGDDNDG